METRDDGVVDLSIDLATDRAAERRRAGVCADLRRAFLAVPSEATAARHLRAVQTAAYGLPQAVPGVVDLRATVVHDPVLS